jgi:hypothetical protein
MLIFHGNFRPHYKILHTSPMDRHLIVLEIKHVLPAYLAICLPIIQKGSTRYCKNYHFVGCDAVPSGRSVPTFCINVLYIYIVRVEIWYLGWKQCVPLKRRSIATRLHGVTSHKKATLVLTTARRAVPWLRRLVAGLSPRRPGSDPGDHFMWDLWWTKWHWDRFFVKYFDFPLSIYSTVTLLHGRMEKT